MSGRTRSPSQETPAVSPPAPTPPTQGPSNAEAQASAGLGAEVCELGIEGLEAAVNSGDVAEARSIAADLPPGDLAELKGNGALTSRALGLIGAGHAADLLYSLQHPHTLWLELANIHCASEVSALQRVLADIGIDTASHLAEHAADFAGLSAFTTSAVMGTLISTSSDVDQAALISTEGGTGLFAALYQSPALEVLTGLGASSQLVLDLYLTSDAGRALLTCHPASLNSHILEVWMTAQEWFRFLAPSHAEDLEGLFGTDPTKWGNGLLTPLSEGAAEDAAIMPMGSHMYDLVIGLVATIDPASAATICVALGYAPADTILDFGDKGWLTADIAVALQANASPGQLGSICGSAAAVAHLIPLGHPVDLLPALATLQAFAGIYGVSQTFRAWMDLDMVRLETLAKANLAPWVAAFIASSAVQPLLDFSVSDPATWRAGVTDAQFQEVLGKLQQPCADAAVDGIWALWTDAARSVDSGFALYHTLFGIRMWSGAQQPSMALPDVVNNGATYERRERFVTVDPDQTAINTYLARLRMLPRGQVAISAVGFGNSVVMDIKRKTPPADADWNATVGPLPTQSFNVSMYFGGSANMIMMATDSAGVISTNAGVQAVASDGNSRAVGGARNAMDDAGVMQTAPTTDVALTYYENHAQHEVGHGVGAKRYAGMSRKGDDQAKKYAKWQNSNPASMKAAHFGGAPASVTDVVDSGGVSKTLSRLEIGDYLMGLIRTGAEPSSSAVSGDPGRVVSRLPGMSRQARVDAINASSAGTEDLGFYADAVINNSRGLPVGSYDYGDFEPTGSTVHIWCDVEGGFRRYDKSTKTNIVPLMGWYSMCSHSEMFAEVYTQYYSTAAHAAPAAQNGVDWTNFFTALEASPDSAIQAGVAPATAGVGGAPAAAAPAPAPGGAGPAPATPGAGGMEVGPPDIALLTAASVRGQPI